MKHALNLLACSLPLLAQAQKSSMQVVKGTALASIILLLIPPALRQGLPCKRQPDDACPRIIGLLCW